MTIGKERRERWSRKERGSQRRKVKFDQLKFPPRAPTTLSPEQKLELEVVLQPANLGFPSAPSKQPLSNLLRLWN